MRLSACWAALGLWDARSNERAGETRVGPSVAHLKGGRCFRPPSMFPACQELQRDFTIAYKQTLRSGILYHQSPPTLSWSRQLSTQAPSKAGHILDANPRTNLRDTPALHREHDQDPSPFSLLHDHGPPLASRKTHPPISPNRSHDSPRIASQVASVTFDELIDRA